jgi:hypothetical protein
MIMKLRLPVLLVIVVATAMFFTVPIASASASPHHARQPAVPHLAQQPRSDRGNRPDDIVVSTLCLNTQNDLCLNLQDCDTTKPVQLYDINTGGSCSEDWYVQLAGNVAVGDGDWPFWCGDDLNATYHGDTVLQVVYAPSTGAPWVPLSEGNTQPVYLTDMEEPNDGLWVATGDTDDTKLIDVSTTCDNDGTVQWVYAGCKGNGCLVRDGTSPKSLLFWEWMGWDLPGSERSLAGHVR